MIQRFIDVFMAAKPEIEAALAKAHPEDYDDLVKRVLMICGRADEDDADVPDLDRLTVIDHGHYQGTRLYIVGAKGYQPRVYWSIFVDYGSCSGCDTFESIKVYADEAPTPEQVGEYWTLMLHMVQQMRELSPSDSDAERAD